MKLLLQCFCFFSYIFCLAQQTDFVDYKRVYGNLEIIPKNKIINGQMEFQLDILKSTDSIFIDAQNMNFKNVLFNNDTINWYNDEKKIWFIKDFDISNNNKLTFRYTAEPEKAMYFVGWENGGDFESTSPNSLHLHNLEQNQVWTQGQGKYTSNWLPSIDDMNDKIEFDLSITFNKEYQVIASGKLADKQINESTITWHYDMQQPMSSYLVAFAIGKYDKKVIQSISGVPIELYYYPEDSLKFEPTYRYTKEIFDFLEEEIGVPYPWQNYKQVPVKDFLYAGMENTSLTIFSDRYVVDSTAFVDRNYVNVNAHELAHQWFGDLVTETSGTHHWLQEGFATYYALLAEKELFGEDHYNWQLYDYAQELLEQDKLGRSTSLLDPKSSSTTFYKKGAWVLHFLSEKIGDRAFKEAVKNYLEIHEFKNVETHDFISEVEKTSGMDLKGFVEKWLNSPELHYDEMEGYFFLTSIDYKGFLQLNCQENPNDCREFILKNNNTYLKAPTISYLNGNVIEELFEIDDIKARQALANTTAEIPIELKEDYESLLNDKSYLTKEIALINLWKNFPEDRVQYLDRTKDIQGFNDKNIRTLWLALALITEDYQSENKQEFYMELVNYTNPSYHFEIRQNAFQYLNSIGVCNDVCQENLIQASKHPVWQFSKFAKQLLETLK